MIVTNCAVGRRAESSIDEPESNSTCVSSMSLEIIRMLLSLADPEVGVRREQHFGAARLGEERGALPHPRERPGLSRQRLAVQEDHAFKEIDKSRTGGNHGLPGGLREERTDEAQRPKASAYAWDTSFTSIM